MEMEMMVEMEMEMSAEKCDWAKDNICLSANRQKQWAKIKMAKWQRQRQTKTEIRCPKSRLEGATQLQWH